MTGRILLRLSLLILSGCRPADHSSAKPSSGQVDHLERIAEKGPVKLTMQVRPAQPRLSDLVEMEIRVSAPPDVEVKAPIFGQAVGDFLVRDYSEKKNTDPNRQPAEPVTHRYVYQLEPLHSGRHLIRSLAIEFIDNRPNSESRGTTALVESDPLEVQVTSEFGDQVPNLNDLDPMVPPQPLNSSSHWKWLALAAVVGLIALMTIWLRRRGKSLESETPAKTPEEIAHAALAQLLSEQLPTRGLVKEFYLRLTGIVRQFIEDTTGLKAPEQTTEEFLREMRTREVFSPQRSFRLKEFLEAADMVKYAGAQPDTEQIELSIARAREFIDIPPEAQPNPIVAKGEG